MVFCQTNKPFVFRCINRLDKDTSGLTVIAKHIVSAGMLSAMVAAKGDSVLERTVNFERGEQAITHYRTVTEKTGTASFLYVWKRAAPIKFVFI